MISNVMVKKMNKNNIEIVKLESKEDAIICAHMMTNSEPWITLRRSFDDSLKILTDPLKEIYIAKSENEILGFTIIVMQGGFVGYIQTVCVSPELRGKGTGSKLLKFAEDRVFKDSPNVFMCVSSFNEKAQKLYHEIGYELIGELKDYIITGHSEILLRKTIGTLNDFKNKVKS